MPHILRHKEWHVYDKSNKERVAHDIEAERLKLELQESRTSRLARLHRLNVLRARHGLPELKLKEGLFKGMQVKETKIQKEIKQRKQDLRAFDKPLIK